MTTSIKKVKQEKLEANVLDPGTPVAQQTYLTPGLVIPQTATADQMASGAVPLICSRLRRSLGADGGPAYLNL